MSNLSRQTHLARDGVFDDLLGDMLGFPHRATSRKLVGLPTAGRG